MTRAFEAIYEGGGLRPLEELDLPGHQRALVEVRPAAESSADSHLAGWQRVYEGLSDAEVEAIARDRGHFSRKNRALPAKARL